MAHCVSVSAVMVAELSQLLPARSRCVAAKLAVMASLA